MVAPDFLNVQVVHTVRVDVGAVDCNLRQHCFPGTATYNRTVVSGHLERVGMRLLVNLLLILPTAAGPWVCCCTASALANLPDWVAKVVGNVPDHGTRRSCCGVTTHGEDKHLPSGKSKHPSGGYAPDSEVPSEPHSCPCAPELRRATTPLTEGGESRLATLFRDLATPEQAIVGFALLPPVSWDGRARGAADFGSDLPFLTATERLFCHHALRC
jgi:hypothetical protein